MPEIWTWSESDLGKLIDSDLDDRRGTLEKEFVMPSAATLAKLARWGKAAVLWERRRFPTHSAGRPAVAGKMSELYVGMDRVHRALNAFPIPMANDETLAKLTEAIGRRISAGATEMVAANEVIGAYIADPPSWRVADGGKPFDMADFDSLNHP
jgi:hypothetical protein